MRVKKGFSIREVCGELILVAEGKENIDFSQIISLNESSALVWEQIQGSDFNAEDIKNILCDYYDVEESIALRDANRLIEKFAQADLIEN